MAVRYVRDIVGVISPALLHTNLQSLNEALLSPWRGHNRQVSTVSGMVPASEQHLRELVIDALVDSFELEIDGDGDVVIIAGGRLMWTWPSHETDYIRLAVTRLSPVGPGQGVTATFTPWPLAENSIASTTWSNPNVWVTIFDASMTPASSSRIAASPWSRRLLDVPVTWISP